jgi:hypothetical protein
MAGDPSHIVCVADANDGPCAGHLRLKKTLDQRSVSGFHDRRTNRGGMLA